MNKNDTESIVKEFLELWQQQFAHTSKEGDNMRQGLDAFTQMQDAYFNAINAGLGNQGDAKSTTTSDILRNIGNEFGRLAKSYAELEGRIARLESRSSGEGETPSGKTKPNTKRRAGKRTSKTNI